MIDFTGSFAPLALLSPLLVALAVAFFFTNKLSARIAKRNAEEEAEMRMARHLKDEEVTVTRVSSLSILADDEELLHPFAGSPYVESKEAKSKGRGKSKVIKGSPRHKMA